ncbi:hypothetical protein CY34DRAFT_813494 [Suillus luteus UH-Slu-Lm8-n1]|uniref:Unplaced genomic scaffold CY34scaffold_767, whole genome shotgun sequence n=1 Tax=Suillus luteus UH-Slu-Lm8-n1 TaxID=930992 RepID=A0A0C9ZW42_9AGAM|nr:hypothetical protein CY34DRAFT_813494 [Suillus luteus UH-Slu-Lm8-n1]
MARRRRVTFESSGSSESDSDPDFSAASSRKASPIPPVENSSPSIEPLKGTKRKRRLSDHDNDEKTKGLKRLQSQKSDVNEDNEAPSHPEQPRDPGETHITGMQQVIIAAIRATDLTLGLRRIPAGFHVVVEADGAEFQTSNKSAHVDQAVVEWNEPILLPCEPSSIVRVSVYASFELSPMLGHGEVLRTFEFSIQELLGRSEHSIIFQPKHEEVVSPCTSLFMTLEQRLSDENDVAVLCPLTTLVSDHSRALLLRTDAGHGLLARYRRTQNRSDLDQSINEFECALDLCPIDHPYRPAALFNLATAKFLSCQVDGRYLDLDIPISLYQDALDLRPTSNPDRPVTQLYLAISLLSRFAKRGFQTDAEAAEELLSEVLDVYHADSHIHRAALLAIETFTLHLAGSSVGNDLVQEQPTASMLRLSPSQLANLAVWCLRRDDSPALDEVISLHYDALRYYNAMHASRGPLLGNLGAMIYTRFQRRGNEEDLDQAIAIHTEGLTLHPVGHPDRCKSLNSFTALLSTRFDLRGNAEDLDQAIAFGREALALCPVGHTDRSGTLHNLADALSTRFDHRGGAEDLDQAIAFGREALSLRLDGRKDRSVSLNHLAVQLSIRFDRRGNAGDLDETIALHTEALALRPVGHTGRAQSLIKLAIQLTTRFDHRGNVEDLDQAIALHTEGLTLHPVGHRYRYKSLTSLADLLSTLFHHQGNVEDIDQAIAFGREALALCPDGHTDRSETLYILANVFFVQYQGRGDAEDLDQAIALDREALALRPVGHPDRSKLLNNLAVRLSARFDHRGNADDVDETISLHMEALALHPVGHRGRFTSLINLANQLFSRFSLRGNVEDLDQSIVLETETLALRPVGHPDRSMSLNNLANSLSTRRVHRDSAEGLDQVIALHREALALRPVGHPDRPSSLNNLAKELSIRFDYLGNKEDFIESRESLHCALTLLTQHDPRRVIVHDSLATIYLSFHRSGLEGTGPDEDADSLNAAMHHLKTAADTVSGGLLNRLQSGLRWVRHAAEYRHGTELDAYATSMQLMDAYMSTTASVSSRHSAMKNFPGTLAVDAASCALRSGDVRRAVELLEQGRTLIWTQMARLRTPLDSLQTHGDHAVALLQRFRDLSSLLDKPPVSHADDTQSVDAEAAATQYRRLVGDWNGVVEEIRRVEGFSRFLLPPLFADLQEAAHDGPIIVLVASRSSCNAIIIPYRQPPTSIQLPTDLEKLASLMLAFHDANGKDASPKGNQIALIKALRKLWDDVVCPVVKNLGGFAPRGSRIWWCPTLLFNFLPLHAAGEYRTNGESLSQQYISSYTPSLTALIRARKSHDMCPSVSFAAIGQNCPAGHSSTLDGVEPELEAVRRLLPPPPTVSFTKITSVDATKSRALSALRDNTWLHFSCHGTQKFTDPFNSAFLMRDQPLTLFDITQMDISRHQFAFLSACETAVGDPTTPDEVIHLAAGLQFAGVKSVIGTLWKVNDWTVQRLVEAFYKKLCGDGKMNSKRAARALHQAVHSLARDKDMPLDQRIVFMHVGV